MIDKELLTRYNAVTTNYKKNQTIFFEGNPSLFYYQVVAGSVKMVNTGDRDKEFIQGIFTKHQSFGVPVLFLDQPYPASAVANEDSRIIKISKESFLQILRECPQILFSFTKIFAQRMYIKSIISKEIAIHNPEHRIVTILNLLRKNNLTNNTKKFKIEMTRQQIADMAGMRVETAIRTIKILQKKEEIQIEKGQIYLNAL